MQIACWLLRLHEERCMGGIISTKTNTDIVLDTNYMP